jgi:aryl-phospho-beta-D-glucosidase BglC (GH1 family)
MQDRFIALWNFLAARYKNESAIAAYDLFNEPGEGTLLPFEQQGAYLYPFYERIISSIRSIDTQHIIMVEPDAPGWYWHNQYVQKYILNKSNIVLSIHFYRFSIGTTYNPSNLADLQNYFTWDNPQTDPTKNWTIPVWVGEFGKGADESNAGLWLRDSINIFSNNQIGWACWTYGKHDYCTMVLLYSNGTERTLLTNELKLK